MFGYLIATGYSEINATFADESGDVGGWEEDEGYGMVFDKSDI